MRRYASDTNIGEEKSRMDIERLLTKRGCVDIGVLRTQQATAIACILDHRQLRFTLLAPKLEHYMVDKAGRSRRESAAKVSREKDIRRRWRALLLVIKSRFVEVDEGISVFDQAFMQYIVLPNGKTAAEWVVPQIEEAYESGQMPQTLMALPAPSLER